jgi:sulfoxide reductase heme-binding subunit YedZ
MNEALWLLGRGTGVAALLLLTLSMGLGVLTAGRYVSKEVPRFALTEIHRRASLAATVLLGVHLVSLWADPVAQLRAVDLLVPFLGARNPVWWGLGTLGMDLVAVLVVTSLLRSRMPYGVWRRLHWLSYATWPLAFLHALGSGTDAGTWWLRGVALGCFVAVAAAAGYRLAGMDVEPSTGPRVRVSPRVPGGPETPEPASAASPVWPRRPVG